MKKIYSFLLTLIITLTSLGPSYASSNVAAENPDLIKLINEGTSTSSINYVSKNGSEINSTFTINNISYEMNESINLQEGIVAIKVYLKEKKLFKISRRNYNQFNLI